MLINSSFLYFFLGNEVVGDEETRFDKLVVPRLTSLRASPFLVNSFPCQLVSYKNSSHLNTATLHRA